MEIITNLKINEKMGSISQNSITPIKLGFVHSYLIKTDEGYVLIDTGYSRKRKDLERKLRNAGCTPGKLQMIILTHQDFDHTGNAAFIREKYNSQITMHFEDAEALIRGDMLWNRKGRNIFTRFFLKILLFVLRMGKFEKFSPDIYLSDGDKLSSYGLEATVLHLPGHSKGSIGILTDNGDLFCGDLFMNGKKSSMVDEREKLNASIEKINTFEIGIVYPGHGSPFALTDFFGSQKD
jgi:glyoxylase-like metal-dependent hydrolase (beta-lactamase superfamily II)